MDTSSLVKSRVGRVVNKRCFVEVNVNTLNGYLLFEQKPPPSDEEEYVFSILSIQLVSGDIFTKQTPQGQEGIRNALEFILPYHSPCEFAVESGNYGEYEYKISLKNSEGEIFVLNARQILY